MFNNYKHIWKKKKMLNKIETESRESYRSQVKFYARDYEKV